MKRFSFNTFLEADGNRAALSICKRIAELEPVAPMPVLLLGEEGCGKTHLLYSIWKRVKATSPRTSLAVVTAREFRREVRDLIGDPSPVQKADSAILLIDQLELFDDLLEELEAVVRIFIDNNQYVLLASNVHPRRLKALPPGLRDMIAAGQTVEIRLREGETQLEVLRRELRRESEAVIEKQQVEIDRLRGLLERVGADAGGNDASAAVRDALEQAQARNAELTRQLDAATRFGLGLREELESVKVRLDASGAGHGDLPSGAAASDEVAQVRAELAEARGELEILRRDLARRGDTEEEIEHLRAALEDAQTEKTRSLAETTAGHESERRRLEEEVATLAQQLEAARNDSAQARHEANMLVERAERLVSQIEGNQIRFRETEQEQRRQIEELETLLAMRGPAEMQEERLASLQQQLEATEDRARTLQQDFDRERRELIGRMEQSEQQIQDELARAREAAAAAQAALEALTAERDQLRDALKGADSERETAQAALEAMTAERDQLRDALKNADSERESLRVQLENLEQERAQLNAALNTSRAERATIESALQETREARERLESALNEGRIERDSLREELDRAVREGQRLQSAVDESASRLETVQAHVGQLETRLAEQAADMEALRHDAAAQVAHANAQAGELEGQIAHLRAQLARAGEARREAARRIEEMRANLAASANALGEWSTRLTAREADSEASGEKPDDASWEPPQAPGEELPDEPAASPREDEPIPEVDEDEQFDDDRMVLPPAPDEEDIEPGASYGDESGPVVPDWTDSDGPEDFGAPAPPLGPLKDLSPLEDERE